MKKCILGLALVLIFFCGCGKPAETTPIYQDSSAVASEFTMEIVEKDSFYYPTVKGSVVSPVRPVKIKGNFDNKWFEIDTFTKVLKIGSGYLVSFNQVVLFGQLDKGEYKVHLWVNDGNSNYCLDCETVFVVDDLYTSFTGYMWDTGKIIDAMDKESYYVGPFHENGLPVMPIRDGSTFIASDFDCNFI